MLPFEIPEYKVEATLKNILFEIHREGGIDLKILEDLAYIKLLHGDIFKKYENTIIYLLGLFYKVDEPSDVVSHIYSQFKDSIVEEHGGTYTPMQASMLKNIERYNNFTFSAPTSTGKSHLFRTLLQKSVGDIVFVVPSRSLLFEYLYVLKDVFKNQHDVFIQQFIDKVNNFKTKRRIFVVTPERAMELFRFKDKFNISYFVFDEAQISEELVRGVTFDALVRRVEKKYPKVKKLFAHPFIENPEAQLIKHNLDGEGILYKQAVVGKQYVEYKKNSGNFYLFSPFKEEGYKVKHKKKLDFDYISTSITNNKKILIYISKQSIISSTFVKEFKKYIELCHDIDDKLALDLISQIRIFIGDTSGKSVMLNLLKKGIVIHHGSIPLVVRSLLEKFTEAGYAKLCFSTSTLLQGVNMPFDVVWVYNHRFSGDEENRVLGLKNLIGRAGRSSKSSGSFDVGAVIVNDPKKFTEELSKKTYLSEKSILDDKSKTSKDSVVEEFVDSIKDDDFNDDYKLPEKRIDRLKSIEVMSCVEFILDNIFVDDRIITAKDYKKFKKSKRDNLKKSFGLIFEKSLGRDLGKGEKTILSKSITILLWHIQGRSFKEILKLRYLYLADQKKIDDLKTSLDQKDITRKEFDKKLGQAPFSYSAAANTIPNSKLTGFVSNAFEGQTYDTFNYDLLVYDTYDYLDKVISFSLSDVYTTAFDLYFEESGDERSLSMKKFFRYGTNDDYDIMLMRYGFTFEDIDWLRDHIDYINDNEIKFLPSINNCTKEQLEILAPFL